MTHFILHKLSTIEVGTPISYRNLTMFPLLNSDDSAISYLTLDEAINSNVAQIKEMSKDGVVSEIMVSNNADEPILIIDGEEVLGAKQNRIFNTSILAPAHKETVCPTSCVERSRWDNTDSHFKMSSSVMYNKARSSKMDSVHESARRYGTKHSDQNSVWANIAEKQASMDTHSSTESMNDIYKKYKQSLDKYLQHMKIQDRQIGALFAINYDLVGGDLFAKHATCKKLLPKLVNSVALDAIEEYRGGRYDLPIWIAEGFLRVLANSKKEEFSAVGDGIEVQMTGTNMRAGALIKETSILHLVAFSREKEQNKNDIFETNEHDRSFIRRRYG